MHTAESKLWPSTFTSISAINLLMFISFHRGRLLVSICGIAGMLLPLTYPVIQVLIVALIIWVIHGAVWSLASTAVSTLACDIIPRRRFGEGMGIFGTGSAISMGRHFNFYCLICRGN